MKIQRLKSQFEPKYYFLKLHDFVTGGKIFFECCENMRKKDFFKLIVNGIEKQVFEVQKKT